MADPIATRLGGSGQTVFTWNSTVIAFAETISVQSPRPVAQPVAVHPMDTRYPTRIMTPIATTMGTLTLQLHDLYNSPAWDKLTILTGANDLASIFERVTASNQEILVSRYVLNPTENNESYVQSFHNCVVTDVRDDEQIGIGTLQVFKNLELGFTHSTYTNRQPVSDAATSSVGAGSGSQVDHKHKST